MGVACGGAGWVSPAAEQVVCFLVENTRRVVGRATLTSGSRPGVCWV
ncbi:hypothetical protein Ae168Ps1_6084c [Pseudonocardia sp. Ae168_Ps1]|nr:hypothetical protein Ae168Ps1_6063c [Pseudonocardia sp. Ae168_Ps1]OLL70619.1 hypothetical protein Ae168Ps1_6084c [Pseudonocardia sp. Ae168_Ps1]